MDKARILIVEDEHIFAMDLSYMLRELGHSVVGTADTGEDAVIQAEKNMPDLILMDIHLRDNSSDGVQAAIEIKRRQPHIPIIYLTALTDQETFKRAKLSEPSQYLSKPIEEGALERGIDLALMNQAKNQQLIEEKTYFAHILDEMGEAIITVNQNNQIFLINRSAEEIIARPREHIIGHKLEELCQWQKISQIPPNLENLKALIQKNIGGGSLYLMTDGQGKKKLVIRRASPVRYPNHNNITRCHFITLLAVDEPTINNLITSRSNPAISPTSRPNVRIGRQNLKIYTLGDLGLLKDGIEIHLVRKGRGRPIELLLLLITLGGREVLVKKIIEQLWPDANKGSGQGVFDSTLHRLRKLLDSHDALLLSSGRLSLNSSICWLDIWELENIFSLLDQELARGVQNMAPEEIRQLQERLFSLYKGHFLAEHTNNAWALMFQDQLAQRFIRYISSIGEFWEANNLWEDAVNTYTRGLEIDALSEVLCRRKIITLGRLDRKIDMAQTYRKYVELLSITMQIPPSEELRTLYRNLGGSVL
ncbi:response regulator [Magnetococcales bacterium HHB-1]